MPLVEWFSDALTLAESVKTALALFGGVTVAGAAGFSPLPRMGFERAIVVALRSVRPVKPLSQRTAQIAVFKRKLEVLDRDCFAAVVGQQGVGKSRFLRTLLAWRPGVIFVEVNPGMSEADIEKKVLTEITGYQMANFSLEAAAKRVLMWHSLFTPVTVVLYAKERLPDAGIAYAGITGAARTFSDKYGTTTIVDVSDNSVPANRLESARAEVLRMEPMDRAMLESIPEFEPLVTALNSTCLDEAKTVRLGDVVWHTMGGVPIIYKELQRKWAEVDSSPAALHEITLEVVADRIGKALGHIKRLVGSNEDMRKFLLRFAEVDYVKEADFIDAGLTRPSPDKVLRLVQIGYSKAKGLEKGVTGQPVLVPATPTVGFVLRYGFTQAPSTEELQDALAAAVAKDSEAMLRQPPTVPVLR